MDLTNKILKDFVQKKYFLDYGWKDTNKLIILKNETITIKTRSDEIAKKILLVFTDMTITYSE
jgi:hypothetical protein